LTKKWIDDKRRSVHSGLPLFLHSELEMGAFFRLVKSLLRLVVAVGAFMLFGYMELQYQAGFVVTTLLGLYLFRNGIRVTSPLIILGSFATAYFQVKILSLVLFLVLDSILMFADFKPSDDTKVALRPYEAEVRQILFKNDPSQMNTVDSLLDSNIGKEKELLQRLNKQYENGPVTPSRSAKKAPITPASSFTNSKNNGNSSFKMTPAEATTVQTPRTTYASTVLQIKNILQRHEPLLLDSLGRLLEEYKGNEGALLQELLSEYEPAPSAARGRDSGTFTSPAPAAPSLTLFSPGMLGAGAQGGNSSGSKGRLPYSSQQHQGAVKMSHYENDEQAGPWQGAAQARSAYQDNVQQDNDTPRVASYHYSTTSTNYRNSMVQQAQEEARREMQARIDARWGAKPASSATGSAQKRRGYAFEE
jgi:hypothetical protein